MRIGIDLDNTIINYGPVFQRVMDDLGITIDSDLGGFDKNKFKEEIIRRKNGSTCWEKIQAKAYGPAIVFATPFEGVKDFLEFGQKTGVTFVIVSHKSQFAEQDISRSYDLRLLALEWLDANGIRIGQNEIGEDIFFADTRAHKAELVSNLALNWFIDDLVDVFKEQAFPRSVTKYLFRQNSLVGKYSESQYYDSVTSWNELYFKLKMELEKLG